MTLANRVDKRRVRAAFSRSTAAYDARASVQRRVRERVLTLLDEAAPGARRAVDVGAGTGALVARLAADRPGLSATAVDLAPAMCAAARDAAPGALVAAADAEALPFRDGAFDLFVSTSAFQWLPRLGPAFSEARRVLAPGGALVAALFGERTLLELREAWRASAGCGGSARTHAFASLGDVAAALAGAGLSGVSAFEEDLVEWHEDARALLRALKAIGASNAVPDRSGLGGRARTLEMLRRYDAAHRGPGGIPATYHVVYAVARRG